MQPREFASLHLMLRSMTLISTLVSKPFLIALRFASTPTRATPARVGDPGAARRPAARGRVIALVTQHLRASVCAKAAPTLARHARLLSSAPVGAGSSPIQRLDSHF